MNTLNDIKKTNISVDNAIAYTGIAMAIKSINGDFIVIANSESVLENLFEEIKRQDCQKLNHKALSRVALVQEKDTRKA